MSFSLTEFLAAFFPDENEAICLRAFKPREVPETDNNKPCKVTVTRRQLGADKALQARLKQFNQNRGIYFTVNAGGDKDEDITRFNSFFCEDDNLSIAEQHARLDTAPLPTSIRVETAKNVHAYWLINGACSREQWRAGQSGLIALFKSDERIKNPSRVMRLPFFNHISLNGDGGFHFKPVKLVLFEPARSYSAEELLKSFPAPEAGEQSSEPGRSGSGSYPTWDELNAELRRRIASHPSAAIRSDGTIHCQGVCHSGKSTGKAGALILFPATGAFRCMEDCETPSILKAFGLPEKPEGKRPKVEVINSDLEQEESSPQLTLEPEAFQGIVGDIVRTIEPHTEADPVALLAQLLVALGNLIGSGPYVKADGGMHGTNLFAILVGKSSKARKGTAWGWIHSIMKDVDEIWESKCIAGGLSSGEGLIYAVRDPLEKGKGQADPGTSDKRLLVVETEFSAALKAMNRDGCTLSAIIRQGFDRQTLRTLTRNSPLSATEPHISIIGHITADELRRLLTEVDCWNGFSNRFLWLFTRRSKLLPEGGKLDSAALVKFFEPLRKAVTEARRLEEVGRSKEFKEQWAEIYPALSAEHPGLLGAVISRAEALTLRLSLLYALLDCSSNLEAKHLKAALAFWQYSEDSARLVFGKKTGDALGNKILEHLSQSEGKQLSKTEISNKLGRHQKAERIDEALDTIRRLGLADCLHQETEGRPVEIWGIKTAKKAN